MSDEVGDAFNAALVKDAKDAAAGTLAAAPDIPAPPRRLADPEAPHGRGEDGAPLAPYGLKADGSPRIKPAGPGRPKSDDKPHVTVSEPSPPAATSGGVDYTEDLVKAGDQIWLILSVNKGLAFLPRKRRDGTTRPLVSLPDTRAHAALLHDQLPGMAKAWNEGAKQNATVRRYVSKLGGEGGVSWVLGVGVTSVIFATGCATLAKPENADKRAELAAANDEELEAYVNDIVEKIGLEAAA